MEFRELRSFVAVAYTLNFSRAADEIHLSQPALSAQIRALEDDLQVQLLERNRRTVRLTAAGQEFLKAAEALLADSGEAKQRVQRIAAGQAGHIRLGFVASAAVDLLPQVVVGFRRSYPAVTFDIRNMKTVEQLQGIRDGELDAGFVRLPLSASDMVITRVHSEPFVLVMPLTHKLARNRAAVLADFAADPFVAYGRRWAPEFYRAWLLLCERAGFQPNVIQETAEMDTLLALVAAGAGLAIVPEALAKRRAKELVIRALPKDACRSEMGLAMRKADGGALLKNLLKLSVRVGSKQNTPHAGWRLKYK